MMYSIKEKLQQLVVKSSQCESTSSLQEDFRRAAVLIYFADVETNPKILLTKRSENLRDHPGQISFPGGLRDIQDEDFVATAYREAREETDLNTENIVLLGALQERTLEISSFTVIPILAMSEATEGVKVVDEAETQEVFYLALKDLLDSKNRYTGYLRYHKNGDDQTSISLNVGPVFKVGEKVVWGFTAHLLDNILNSLNIAEPWDNQRKMKVEK